MYIASRKYTTHDEPVKSFSGWLVPSTRTHRFRSRSTPRAFGTSDRCGQQRGRLSCLSVGTKIRKRARRLSRLNVEAQSAQALSSHDAEIFGSSDRCGQQRRWRYGLWPEPPAAGGKRLSRAKKGQGSDRGGGLRLPARTIRATVPRSSKTSRGPPPRGSPRFTPPSRAPAARGLPLRSLHAGGPGGGTLYTSLRRLERETGRPVYFAPPSAASLLPRGTRLVSASKNAALLYRTSAEEKGAMGTPLRTAASVSFRRPHPTCPILPMSPLFRGAHLPHGQVTAYPEEPASLFPRRPRHGLIVRGNAVALMGAEGTSCQAKSCVFYGHA